MRIRIFNKLVLLIFCFSISYSFSLAQDETPALLFENIQTLMKEGREGQEKGDYKLAKDKYRTASYLLEKIQQDFPEWSRQTVIRDLERCRTALQEMEARIFPQTTPSGPLTITCLWQMVFPGPDFEPEDGDIYEISLEGEDQKQLLLSFKKLKPYQGDARICVRLENTPSNTVLQDIKNQALFQKDKGEFQLSLSVPPECPFFLAEFNESQMAEPVILSNILELP